MEQLPGNNSCIVLTQQLAQYSQLQQLNIALPTGTDSLPANLHSKLEHRAIPFGVPPSVHPTRPQLSQVDTVAWQSALPFDSDVGQTTVVTIRRSALTEHECTDDAESRAKAARAAAPRPVANYRSKIVATPLRGGGAWLEEWVEGWRVVYKCWGKGEIQGHSELEIFCRSSM